ncbi:MAG: type II toxin-antitoxin system YafQ family toxin [Thermodesulfobacteriota bacterium]|nr:type II toxin-antitoxin system YafQ family toxin [Thermodesulfobacteriota bacterium]
MLPIRPTSGFKKDLKRAAKQRRNLKKLRHVLKQLAIPAPLPPKYKDHKLKGNWINFRECYIEPDWLLIYTISDFELRPVRVGTHSELFD